MKWTQIGEKTYRECVCWLHFFMSILKHTVTQTTQHCNKVTNNAPTSVLTITRDARNNTPSQAAFISDGFQLGSDVKKIGNDEVCVHVVFSSQPRIVMVLKHFKK